MKSWAKMIACSLVGEPSTDHHPPEMHQEASLELPTEALLQAAEKADLLVIGSPGRHIVRSTTLGSTSHALVHYSDCAVAVVR